MENQTSVLPKIDESNLSEGVDIPQELPRPTEAWSKPNLRINTAQRNRSDSKSSHSSHNSFVSPTPKTYRNRSETSSTVNHTPSWRSRPTPCHIDFHNQPTEHLDTEKPSNNHPDPLNVESEPFAESIEALNSDAGETSILEDLEAREGFGSLGGAGQDNLAGAMGFADKSSHTNAGVMPNNTTERGRSASVSATPTDLLTRLRGRKYSQESVEYLGFDYMSRKGVSSTLQYCCKKLIYVLRCITPNIYDRLNVYLVVFFLMVISFLTRRENKALPMVRLYACTVALEFACAISDRIVYKCIDFAFASRFDVAYQLHSVNGPLGWIVAIFIMRSYWSHNGHLGLNADALFPTWSSILTALSIIVICLAGKNWLTRRQYITLLENRFTAKVENLNTMIIILSELASTRPPKSVQLKRAESQRRTSSDGDKSGTGTTSTTYTGTTSAGSTIKHLKNVFADLVNDTEEVLQQEEVITRRELYLRRRSFWQSAARLNATAGRMKVITYNGVVNIHNQAQAKEFGRKLFKHLSKGGKVVVTPELIRKLFEERRALFNINRDQQDEHDAEMQSVVTGRVSQLLWESEGEVHDLWARAAALFDPYNLGRISEDFCVEAVLNIYKEQRFTAASISDFGELHQSLRIGIDIVYWIIMLFVLQNIFGFDINNYILPFITLLVSFSFAISSLVGNVFLAFAFVFFMAPFDVGHKVQIGLVSSSVAPPVGYVKSVSLMYTVINTSTNETVKIPNSALWSEKVFNLTETSGAVHEFVITFNIHDSAGGGGSGCGGNADYGKIQLFLTRLKHYTIRETQEWKSFFVAATMMDTTTNTMEYRVYCTHREGWGFCQAATTAKIEYYNTIKRLCEQLGLYYVKIAHPVEVTHVDGELHGANGVYGYGGNTSRSVSTDGTVSGSSSSSAPAVDVSAGGHNNNVCVEGVWRQRSNAIHTPTSAARANA